jgi:hypothetical protein
MKAVNNYEGGIRAAAEAIAALREAVQADAQDELAFDPITGDVVTGTARPWLSSMGAEVVQAVEQPQPASEEPSAA